MIRTSIIIVNYNGSKDTAACVASLMTSIVPVFIIVVDNTPNDPELEMALAKFTNIKLLHTSENIGFGCANNLGISWALNNVDYEFVFILNNDTTIEPDTIRKLEKAMDARSECDLVSPKIVVKDDPNILWYGGGEISWIRGGGFTPGMSGPSNTQLAECARFVTFASGCALLVRRNIFNDIGYFDDRFFMYEEDVNLCMRLQNSGIKIWYEPSSIVFHLRQGSMNTSSYIYLQPLHPDNPNLNFYLYHINRNKIINILELTWGYKRVLFLFGWSLWVIRNSFRLMRYGRFEAIRLSISAIVEGIKIVFTQSNI